MSIEIIAEPIPGPSGAGEDCAEQIHSRNLPLMYEYVVERAVQKSRDAVADREGVPESEKRNSEAIRDEGKRKLTSLEGILKDVLHVSSVSLDIVAKSLHEHSLELLSTRGKDLRLIPMLAASSVLVEGLDGYIAVVNLANELLARFPSELFPLPDKDGNPWARQNAVSEAVSGSEIRALLSNETVIDARQSGRVTLGQLVGGLRDDMPETETQIPALRNAVLEMGADHVHGLSERLKLMETGIRRLLDAVKFSNQPKAEYLADQLKRAWLRLSPFIDQKVDNSSIGDALIEGGVVESNASTHPAQQSRREVRRAIQELVRTLEEIAPGHPAPLLLKRADRLLGLDFLDIIKDLAPNAFDDIERITGSERK